MTNMIAIEDKNKSKDKTHEDVSSNLTKSDKINKYTILNGDSKVVQNSDKEDLNGSMILETVDKLDCGEVIMHDDGLHACDVVENNAMDVAENDSVIENNTVANVIENCNVDNVIKNNILENNTVDNVIENNTVDNIIENSDVDKVNENNTVINVIENNNIVNVIENNTIDNVIANNTVDNVIEDNTVDNVIKDNTVDNVIESNDIDNVIESNDIDNVIEDNKMEVEYDSNEKLSNNGVQLKEHVNNCTQVKKCDFTDIAEDNKVINDEVDSNKSNGKEVKMSESLDDNEKSINKSTNGISESLNEKEKSINECTNGKSESLDDKEKGINKSTNGKSEYSEKTSLEVKKGVFDSINNDTPNNNMMATKSITDSITNVIHSLMSDDEDMNEDDKSSNTDPLQIVDTDRSENNDNEKMEKSSTEKDTEISNTKELNQTPETSAVKSGQKRAIEDSNEEARQSLKKVRIFNSSNRNFFKDSKPTNTESAEVNAINKRLEDEKTNNAIDKYISKSNGQLFSTANSEQIDRLTAKELEKLRESPNNGNKKLEKISRKDLENIVVQLFAEKLLYEDELGCQRDLCKRLEATLEANRKKAAQFHKEIDDLQKVTTRLQSEYNTRKGQIVTPVKVKRSVGIHVTPSIINKGITSSESVINNVKYISPSKPKKPIEKPQKKIDQAVKSTVTATSAATTIKQTVIPTTLVNNSNNTKPSAINQVVVPSATITKTGFIDLTDDEEANKKLLKPMAGTSMVAIPRQAISLANSGQFVALPQSSVNSLLLVPPSAATLVVTSMGNTLQNVAGVNTAIRTSNPTIGLNVSPNVSGGTPTRLILRSPITGTSNTLTPKTTQVLCHPAPLPKAPPQQTAGFTKKLPPQPILNLSHKDNTGIVLLWKMAKTDAHEAIASYQLYAYQEGSAPPFSSLWKKVGSVKALELPMACTLTQFMSGHTYHFAVRAVDIRNRLGPFSEPKSIRLKK